jgi:hypothetical protein
MDFGLFAHSATPSFDPFPVHPLPVRHEFSLGHLESQFIWWCIKSLFWYAIVRDFCLVVVPFVVSIAKTAIENSFKSEFHAVEEVGEVDEIASEIGKVGEAIMETTENVIESSVLEGLKGLEGVVSAGTANGAVQIAEGIAQKYLETTLPELEDAAEEFIGNAVFGRRK